MHILSFLQYISLEKRYSNHTYTSYKTDLEQFKHYTISMFETSNLLEIRTDIVRSWVIHLIDSKDSNSTINRKLSTLKSFYNFLVKKGLITINPTKKIIRPKTAKRLPTFIEEDASEELLNIHTANPEDYISYRNFAMLHLLYTTGIRRSELQNLEQKHIDFSNKTIKVLGKGKKERLVPISSETLEILDTLMKLNLKNFVKEEEAHFIFRTEQGKKIYPELIYKTIKKQLSHVSTNKKRSPHVLRHSFATQLLNNGASLIAIKDLLGHSSLAATQVYTHSSINKLKKSYESAHPKA